MLKRVFGAITIIIPLYLFMIIEQSPQAAREFVQWSEQPKQIISSVKRNLARLGQDIQRQQELWGNSGPSLKK